MAKSTKQKRPNPSSHWFTRRRLQPWLFVLGFAATAATIFLLVTVAAPPTASFEAEDAARSGSVRLLNDSSASAGAALQFGSGTATSGRCQHTATRVCYNGQLWYLSGADMPWRQWPYTTGVGDFGGNNNGGVLANRASISSKLAQFHNSGSSVVRWWMFQGGAWQINRDANGRPTSLNPAIYADIDAALELANQHDIYYNFTLFGGMQDSNMPRAWRTNTAYRQDLANVLAPLFARYKDNPRVMSWEIWNEPEWQYNNGVDGATKEQAIDMANRIVAVIRQQAPKTMITVGQSLISNLGDWKDVDLDFDSPHWYDIHTGSGENALTNTAAGLQARFGTNRPIILGEYAHTGTQSQNVARMNEFYNRGYGGAWTWSLFYDQTGDQLQVDLAALGQFNQQHNDIGPH